MGLWTYCAPWPRSLVALIGKALAHEQTEFTGSVAILSDRTIGDGRHFRDHVDLVGYAERTEPPGP